MFIMKFQKMILIIRIILGFPANNFNFEVVDDNLNEVEVGSIGELR